MVNTATVSQSEPFYSSEIFRLKILSPSIICFQLTPKVEQDEGIRLSFHLSRILPSIVIIWHKPYFYAVGKCKESINDLLTEWKDILEQLFLEGFTDFSEQSWDFQEVPITQPVSPIIIAQLAYQVLKSSNPYPFLSKIDFAKNNVEVRRTIKFWAETIEIENIEEPAITLTIESKFLINKNLNEYYLKHPDSHNPDKLLVGLRVQDRSHDISSIGTITKLIMDSTPEHREKLINQAKHEISKQALRDALSEKILVAVQFGKNKKVYEYGMAALRLRITPETASRFGADWGQLLKETKIPYQKRQELLVYYKREADNALSASGYGFKLEQSINSRHYSELFWQPPVSIENTKLIFGNGFTYNQSQILVGLSKGGVYRRHETYLNPSRPIRITVLNLCDLTLDEFIDKLKVALKSYKFEGLFVTQSISLKSLSGTEARVKAERAVNELMDTPPDIVLTFLPQCDRKADEQAGGSLYHTIYDLLIRRQIASQIIYENTLKNAKDYKYILQQVVPGILAKLGNLPFVLAEALQVADYFIGLDISRQSKAKLSGTVNACASIRLYGKQGEFIRYRLEDALIEGEEIPKRVLERLLPAKELQDKTVLIYRDGRFCGQEVDNLLEWAKAIGCKLILVECRKSGIPRLYKMVDKTITDNKVEKILTAPEKGLALRISSSEALLVTTQVTEKIGLAFPLRLTIINTNHPALISPPIEEVVETTLKLTLLHHGALKTPRLPMPVYGAHKTAKLRLKGIYPSSMLEGDRQFWL
ncbi:stem cell self-renewal protein Piwi [Cylindrospermum sp. FACHB-282]|nr:stem cell self-renewal protein Piwi [Cylindrospermum sp. FACHB-282]